MRALLVLVCAVFLISACSREVKQVSASSAQDPVQVEDQTTIELRLSEAALAKYVDKDAGVWQEARTAGMNKLFNKMLQRNIIFVPMAGMAPLGDADGEYVQAGHLSSVADEETGDKVQNFLISANFIGDLDLGGQIVSLGENRYISAMHDIAYAQLYKTTPADLPAYAVIAEPVKEMGASFYRVIGMAEIKQLMQETVMLPKEQGGTTGPVCLLEIVTSTKEAEVGDRIFLLSTKVAALDSETVPATTAANEPETVVILPPHKDSAQEPSEHK